MSTYDPRAKGAKCDHCPLNQSKVVPPEYGHSLTPDVIQNGDGIVIIGEAPGDEEERTGRPFSGKSGEELDRTMHLAGLRRKDVLITNSILCKPPKNKLKDLLTLISKENKKKEKDYKEACKDAELMGFSKPEAPEMTQSPVDCCRPRLQQEIVGFTNFITLGGTATRSITGTNASIMAIRGGLMAMDATEHTTAKKVMPTVHPSFALRQPKYIHVMRNDFFKAVRWFRNIAVWQPPELVWHPTPDKIREYLNARKGKILAYDLETDGIEALTANIRCLSIGDETTALAIAILSKEEGRQKFLSPEVEAETIAILKEYFEGPETKYGWNVITYDATVLRSQWGIEVKNQIDGILLHKSAESEMPHGLGYVGSLYTEAPSWKTDRESGQKLAFGSETDEQLLTYCCMDTNVTYKVLAPITELVQLRDQVKVFKQDSKVQEICSAMHEVGMYVDQNKRLYFEKKMLKRRHELLGQIRAGVGIDNFNPGSTHKVRDLLFERWKIEVPLDEKDRFTGSGDASTSDLVLRTVLTDRTVPVEQRELIKLIRYYRKIQKTLGTYVTKLRYTTVEVEKDLLWDDEDEEWADKEAREKYGLKKMGIVDPRTNRMHPGYSAVPPVTGRLSSSKPINAMNFVKALRSMITAQPGNILVGADSEQIEVRVAASWWQIEKYLLAFREGKDVHSMSTFMIFGDAFCKAAGIEAHYFTGPGKLVGASYDEKGTFKGKGDAANLRKLGKITHLACIAAHEPVAVLDSRREVPISELKPGDWVYATKHNMNCPTKVAKAWCTGKRKCITLTLKDRWDGVTTVTLTPDHPVMLESGDFIHACELDKTDLIMPWNTDGVKVVGVVDAGEFEVWDIEVEHEDHNFALACGIFVHNSQYMAGTEQVHKIIQSTEVPAQGPDGKDLDDGTTDLPYALMPLTRTRGMHEKWVEGAPEYKAGWERDINLFKRQGFLREPINGRRRDFLDSLHGTPDDLAPNEIVNFSVQSMAAALISASMIQVYEQIPKNKWGPGTGIINQCHDHIVVECPESEAMWVKGVLEEAMNHSHSALPGVKFAATADIAKSWDKT